jgi:hypothetical protein
MQNGLKNSNISTHFNPYSKTVSCFFHDKTIGEKFRNTVPVSKKKMGKGFDNTFGRKRHLGFSRNVDVFKPAIAY